MQNPIDEPEAHFSVRGDRRNGVDRLTLVGELDRSSVPMLEGELEHVAHAGGALIIDLRDLDTVDEAGVQALEATAQHAGQYGWWLFIVNCRGLVRDAFERSGADMLLSDTDVSVILASGTGSELRRRCHRFRSSGRSDDCGSSGTDHERLARARGGERDAIT